MIWQKITHAAVYLLFLALCAGGLFVVTSGVVIALRYAFTSPFC